MNDPDDPFVRELVEFMSRPIDVEREARREAFFREHGCGGILFANGARLPGLLDGIRFDAFESGGLEGLERHDREMADAVAEYRRRREAGEDPDTIIIP